MKLVYFYENSLINPILFFVSIHNYRFIKIKFHLQCWYFDKILHFFISRKIS